MELHDNMEIKRFKNTPPNSKVKVTPSTVSSFIANGQSRRKSSSQLKHMPFTSEDFVDNGKGGCDADGQDIRQQVVMMRIPRRSVLSSRPAAALGLRSSDTREMMENVFLICSNTGISIFLR
ncbi:hypothetical protein EVAR_16387_1 [Eumeta japonica]|uniref:Uncharacterized protein n=1 Tax=Eumeta variegata TaxID=151549 RepID=A0A4C1VU88_EUMVA|nr:hypothetical protein EVAR_16387_1 [Eumeta japonica]